MAYSKQTWADDSAGGTPLSASRLQHMEDGIEAAAADSGVGDLTDLGITATATELNYSDGVTSAIQTQLDVKQPLDADLTALAALTAPATKLSGIEALADVTDAANVAAAGAVMESDTSTAAMNFVVDEDNMASNSATKVPTQQSVKAYVDANGGGSGLTAADLHAATSKTTPVDADELPLIDSAASNGLKKLTWASLKATALAAPIITGAMKLATGGQSEIHNQADQTTNYERLLAKWDTNNFEIKTNFGGTGASRTLRIGIAGVAGNETLSKWLEIKNSSAPFFTTSGSTPTAGTYFQVAGTFSGTSGVQNPAGVNFTVNQSGTAGYTGLLVNATETATGSGVKKLIDAQVGGTSKFSVDSTGKVTLSGTAATWSSGTGSPEGVLTAPVGSVFTRTDGGANTTLYTKESGTGNTGWVASTIAGGSGGGDASTNTTTSVVSEVALFADTAGKTLKRATGSGLAKLTSGVLGTATAGTDYYAPAGTDIPITDGGTGVSNLPTGLLKGAGTSPITAAVAGTDYVAPATQASIDKWIARNPGQHLVPSQRITYYDKADAVFASLPTTMDTGQAITYSAGTTSDQAFISGGALQVTNSAGGTSAACYMNLDAGSGNSLTRIGFKFKLLSGVAGTAGAAVAMSFANGATLGAGGTAYRIGAHLTLNYQTWTLSKVSNATGSLVFTQLATGSLINPLEWGTGAEYTMEMWRVGNAVVIMLPDGQRVVSPTDTDIGAWSGRYGFFEHFLVLKATDTLPAFTEAWADIGTQYPPGSGLGSGAVVHTSGAESIAGVKTFTDAPIVEQIHVIQNGGSGSASLFLEVAGQTWEFFNNSGGQFGVWDGTNSKQPLTIVANTPADALKLNASGLITGSVAFRDTPYATGSRPSASTLGAGACVYDTTLHKPIWSDGTNWKDATGTTV